MLGQKLNVTVSNIERVKTTVSLEELVRGLRHPPILDWAPTMINSRDVLPTIQEMAPLAVDIVEWMQLATAERAVFKGAAEDYARAGSAIAIASDDAYIPGASTTGIYAISTNGVNMRSQGFGQASIGGQLFNVPPNGKTTIVGTNFLAWASIPDPGAGTAYQWVMTLMNWLELARAPITEKIRFASSDGLTAPHFFMISTLPTPIQQLIIGIQSNKAQQLLMKGRYTGNFTTKIFELPIDVPEGESNITLFVKGFPIVPPYALELQPEDNTLTTLTMLTTRPM